MRFSLSAINKYFFCFISLFILFAQPANALPDALPLYGESCATQQASLTEIIAQSEVCDVDTDCVQVNYNMDGCNCPSFANKNQYVRSIERKTQTYYKDCIQPYQLTALQCNCERPVKHRCYWKKCVPIRCDFRKTYNADECICPVGSEVQYNREPNIDGTIKETIYCKPKPFMLTFPDEKKE